MKTRNSGWYWVKKVKTSRWTPMEFTDGTWVWSDRHRATSDSDLFLIGPRAPTPDEMAQK